MDNKKVKILCEDLIRGRDWPWKDEEVKAFGKRISKDLTPKKQIYLLICLVNNDNVFRWLKLVSYLIPNLPAENRLFIDLLEQIISKVKGDMAQGDFIRALINIGEKNPEKGINLYSRLIESSDESTIQYSGLVLGGVAKQKFPDIFEMIEKDLSNKKVPVKVACLKALRVAFETKRDGFPHRILDILDEMWKLEEPSIRMEVIQGYIDFRHYNYERCERKLLEITKIGNSLERFTILNRLWFEKLADQSIEIKILNICSEDNNPNVLEGVMRVLSQKGQAFLDDSLEIIRRILKKGPHYGIPIFEYAVKKLCEKKWDVCNAEFEKWHESDKDAVFRLRLTSLRNRLAGKSLVQEFPTDESE